MGARKRGFTLIEIMVILLFMILAASIAIPRYATFQRASQARDVARNIAALVREARETAIDQGRPVSLNLNPQSKSFTLLYDDSWFPQASNTGSSPAPPVGGAPEAPRPPLFFPDKLAVDLQVIGNPQSLSTGSGLLFTPDGHVPDADIVVAYGPARALHVLVTRQGTRIQIVAGAPETAPMGMPT